MATLTVLRFASPDGAQQARDTLESLQQRRLVTVLDAAIVTWPEGAKRPKTRRLPNLVGIGALSEAFWALLTGLLFFIPFFGLAIGVGMGAIFRAFSDAGIDDEFIKRTQERVTPGSSALFLLSVDATVDRVVEELKAHKVEVITANLSHGEEAKLHELITEEASTDGNGR